MASSVDGSWFLPLGHAALEIKRGERQLNDRQTHGGPRILCRGVLICISSVMVGVRSERLSSVRLPEREGWR